MPIEEQEYQYKKSIKYKCKSMKKMLNSFEENPKKVDTNDESSWRVIIAPVEIEFFLLKQNHLYLSQSEYEAIPFATDYVQQKFDRNTSAEEANVVLQGICDDSEDEELPEIMKLVLKCCVQMSP